MDSRQLIDAQFNRAVEIVQDLLKNGSLQTSYEEKLTVYSLYKQATVGNVTGPRPGLFDVIGKAKWDAWEKHRDLDQYEAKWLYVDALLKTLSKYSDKTVARDLINELRSYGGDYGNLVLSYTQTRTGSRGSSDSGSTVSEDNAPLPQLFGHHDMQHPSTHRHLSADASVGSSDDGEAGDENRDLPAGLNVSQQRPLSSISFSSRYKTPLAGSLAMASPPPHRTSVPPMQPLPPYEAQSAFADPPFLTTTSYAALSSSRDSPSQVQPASRYGTASTFRPPSRVVSLPLERAMERMQAHLAALMERIDTLESALAMQSSQQAQRFTHPSRTSSGSGSSMDSQTVPQAREWDIENMGLWTLILKPAFQNLSFLRHLVTFFLTSDQDRSPLWIVIRRLCLDISFIMVVVGILRAVWVKSGTRRKEIGAALVMLWGAVRGKKPPRIPGVKHLRL